MWRIGPDRCDSWFSFGKRSQLKQFKQKLSTQTIITISSHRTWVWDITRHQGGKSGNTSGTRRMEESDSGSLDSTTRASSDVSEMRWSVHHLSTNETIHNYFAADYFAEHLPVKSDKKKELSRSTQLMMFFWICAESMAHMAPRSYLKLTEPLFATILWSQRDF